MSLFGWISRFTQKSATYWLLTTTPHQRSILEIEQPPIHKPPHHYKRRLGLPHTLTAPKLWSGRWGDMSPCAANPPRNNSLYRLPSAAISRKYVSGVNASLIEVNKPLKRIANSRTDSDS